MIKGDINLDSDINVFDIIIIVNFILFGDEPDPFYLFKADLDKDGQVNIQDIILLVNLIL